MLTVIPFAFSCGSDKKDDIEVTNIEKIVVSLDSHKISAQNVFNSLPARNEIISLTEKAQAQYNAEALNNPENTKNYTLESSIALNLGVYGADLYVTGVYEQTQESFTFLSAANILAKNLGVSHVFDEAMVDRMDANKENRDSTMAIITQSFKKIDDFLVSNGRPGASSLVVAGSWIESIYLSCHTAKDTKSEAIVKEIFSQKESLKYIIDLLRNSKISSDAQYIITDLVSLKAIFDSKTNSVYTLASISDIEKKIIELRTKVVVIK